MTTRIKCTICNDTGRMKSGMVVIKPGELVSFGDWVPEDYPTVATHPEIYKEILESGLWGTTKEELGASAAAQMGVERVRILETDIISPWTTCTYLR